jgi:Protein of unknown function (DUF1553)/Protein of unknown function (DUF1549)/Planctomycete cytochrome C
MSIVVCPKCSTANQTLEAFAGKAVRCAICGHRIELLESSEPVSEAIPLESVSTPADTQDVSKLPELESPQRTGSRPDRKLRFTTARYAFIGIACLLIGAASVVRLFFVAPRSPSQNFPTGLVKSSAQPAKKNAALAQSSVLAATHREMKALERVTYRLPSSKDSEKLLRFNRDVHPILSNHCFRCHGRDGNARKGGVQLDVREKALLPADSGAIPIVPSQPAKSELVRRILSADASEAMPPPSANQPLTDAEKVVLKRWIAEGARYEPHWAFLAPERRQPPIVKQGGWPHNAIDNFILARLEQEGLEPSPQTDWVTLFRRLSLDLTGLPPDPADVAAFAREIAAAEREVPPTGGRSAATDIVYDAWVSRLLASPSYGERMAVDWLDCARYADTNGYHMDRNREMSAWRDWVIDALNSNQPFDEFTVDQLAGDLLPGATLKQKIATGFHRNNMFNEEGGIADEYLAEYCVDRVDTTATVWLGLTLRCCRCHDHKFDPFTQRDYYGLFAFFHNVPEVGVGSAANDPLRTAPPFIDLPPVDEVVNVAGGSNLKASQGRRVYRTALVMQEMATPRETHILMRGAYDKPAAEVTAGVPAALPPLSPDLPCNRLGLARWLVDPTNPLPARVTVNRLWQSVFGSGLVRTTEDFGTQGELPSHPELLDWLATEFMRREWEMKALLRLLVTSSTYRQSSRLTTVLRDRDPENRLLARGARYRLQAEFLRDQALAASGLLVSKIGGRSVRPYQPPGLYEQVTSGLATPVYIPGSGSDLYRRSLYTYWRRSVPNPTLLLFDAPSRETCTVRRPRTDTPLQALDLMNDPTYVEAARALAQRMVREGGDAAAQRLAFGFRCVLSRSPRKPELDILVSAHLRALKEFQAAPVAAAKLLKVGNSSADPTIDPAELAALTTVASTLLNLDEAVTKQ